MTINNENDSDTLNALEKYDGRSERMFARGEAEREAEVFWCKYKPAATNNARRGKMANRAAYYDTVTAVFTGSSAKP